MSAISTAAASGGNKNQRNVNSTLFTSYNLDGFNRLIISW
jgi:hypothetical protein